MIFASFTAWQIGCQNGLKTNWNKYLSELNLIEKEQLDPDDKKELTETSLRIMRKLGKIK